ncbi:amidase [uncultured Desulfosarcina sp.]|uniref:amidase n=1 Tax=uncultured Desulfosarcina sp. TaxID=218289 RepID=UPI0029C96DE3|nr:amidase [uncultured Desulfosarcina sp.]
MCHNAIDIEESHLVQSIDRLCRRITDMDETLKVFVPETFQPSAIRTQADKLISLYPDPDARPPLFGRTVGIKDIFHCDGFTTRCGSDLPPDLFQGAEAELVRRLKTAGAIMMGKTATTEFAYFAPAPTVNPHDPARTPGGSSSGSAAGVAAGFFSLGLGTQTVGSIIRPAAYCGVVGFKPSFGRVSTAGVVPFSQTVDHAGFFSRTFADLVTVMAAIDDAWQPVTLPGQLRLGIPRGAYLEQAEPAAREAFQHQIRQLEANGCTIVDIPILDDILAINERHGRLIAGEMARVHARWYEAQQERYRQATRDIISRGREVDDAEFNDLRQSCMDLRTTLETAMQTYDIDAWICPATTGEAPLGLESTGSPLMNLPWTHSGLPAITLPAGRGPAGLPLGLQLAGSFMADEALLALAGQAAAALPI